MPQFSNPNQSDPSASSNMQEKPFEMVLKAGLDAIEKKNFPEAIAKLETVQHHAKRRSLQLRAEMGLVKAYEGMGEYQKAFIRCRDLLKSSSEPTRQWAEAAIKVLKQHYTQLPQSLNHLDQRSHKPQTQPSVSPPEAETLIDDIRKGEEQRSPLLTDVSPLSDAPTEDQFDDHEPHESDGRSPFLTEASTLVDPLAVEPSTPSDPTEASTAAASIPSNDSSNPTGFVPIDDRPNLNQDSTGFVSLSSAHKARSETQSQNVHPNSSPHSSPSTNQAPSSQSVASKDDQAEQAWELEGNPFAFDIDGLNTSDDDVNSADYVRFDQGAFKAPTSESDTDTTDSSTFGGSSPVDDAELAAALSMTAPRSRKQKRTQNAQSSSPSPPEPARARNWRPLKPIRQLEFWLSYTWTAIALVLLFTGLTYIALDTAKPVWRFLQRSMTPPRWFFLENHTLWAVTILLGLGLLVSQWVLTIILKWCYGVKPLPDRELDRRSPETMRLLKRTCKQHKFPVPRLKISSSQAPFVMSYGLLPRTSQIVVSQGLLTQLNDAEIAALYAGELGHIQHRTTVVLMLLVTLTQIPFLIYRYSAAWGDRQRNAVFRNLAIGVSSIAYGLFWLWRWPGLWLSRTRQVQGDRYAVNLTGNPNGRVLALAAVYRGMAQAIERSRSTEFILASLEMLMPVSPLQALTVGSPAVHSSANATVDAREIDPNIRLSSFLPWGVHNPHRRWLLVNNTHPLLGDRIQALNRDAEYLRLRPSVVIPAHTSHEAVAGQQQPFWLQASPYLGGPIGFVLAIALWIAGGIADMANVDQLEWLWKDMSLLYGCMAMGFSFGTLMRINGFFPDISPSQTQAESSLPMLTQDHQTLPLNSVPVTFEGRLLGRSGISNGLGQDLMLKTSEGTIKLHWVSPIGPLGNLIIGKVRPASLVGRSVSVTGWFRRGATVWIDVEKIRADGRTLVYGSHPLWSTVAAIAMTLWGAYIIYRGSL